MTSIAVCMIALNEEEVLQRCLNSVAGLWDELIVVVDSRTTDRTSEIVLEAGGTVLNYDFVYPGNKGAARNVGIDGAVSQWIVVIDADEVLINAAEVRTEIIQSNADALSVQFNNFINGEITLSWRQIRIFQRGAFVYKYREHEIPVAAIANPIIGDAPILFEHRSPGGRAQLKSSVMLERLAADFAENPNDPHPLYFYHRQCLIQGCNDLAISLGREYLELTKNGGFIQAEIYSNIAAAYQNLGNLPEAQKQMHLAAACEPHKREWLYRLAALYQQATQYNVALAMLRAAAELMPHEDRQWEPQTTARIYQMIDSCQHAMLHQMAHSH